MSEPLDAESAYKKFLPATAALSPAAKTGAKPAEVDVRDRLGTLLWNAHVELRKIAHYFHGERFEEIAPALQSRSVKRKKQEEEPPK